LDTVKEDIQKTTEDIKDKATKLTDAAEWASLAINSGGGATTYCPEVAVGHTTYVDVLNSHLPSTHQSTLTRSRIKNRQVLIDRDASEGCNLLQGLTECELVTKAN